MRLFTAVLFQAQLLDRIYGARQNLQDYALRGNFTNKENLHLTLVFLGEVGKTGLVIDAMDQVQAPPFSLQIGGLGRFRRQGGDIYWLGVRQTPGLLAAQSQLAQALRQRGFPVESRPYTPHLTLGREVEMKPEFDPKAFEKSLLPMEMQAEKISLMKSERVGGRLTYTELYARPLSR